MHVSKNISLHRVNISYFQIFFLSCAHISFCELFVYFRASKFNCKGAEVFFEIFLTGERTHVRYAQNFCIRKIFTPTDSWKRQFRDVLSFSSHTEQYTNSLSHISSLRKSVCVSLQPIRTVNLAEKGQYFVGRVLKCNVPLTDHGDAERDVVKKIYCRTRANTLAARLPAPVNAARGRVYTFLNKLIACENNAIA